MALNGRSWSKEDRERQKPEDRDRHFEGKQTVKPENGSGKNKDDRAHKEHSAGHFQERGYRSTSRDTEPYSLHASERARGRARPEEIDSNKDSNKIKESRLGSEIRSSKEVERRSVLAMEGDAGKESGKKRDSRLYSEDVTYREQLERHDQDKKKAVRETERYASYSAQGSRGRIRSEEMDPYRDSGKRKDSRSGQENRPYPELYSDKRRPYKESEVHGQFEHHPADSRRGSQEHKEEANSRRPYTSNREREGSPLSTMHEIKEEPPLPPTPSRIPPAPAPLDLPRGRESRDYGELRHEEDARLRAELFPLEENMLREKFLAEKRDEAFKESHLNLISAETFGHGNQSKGKEIEHEEPPSSKELAIPGMTEARKHSSRTTPHEGSAADEKKEGVLMGEEVRRGDSLRRRSTGETKSAEKKGFNYSILKEEEEEPVERNSSVLLPVLEDTERVFHELVALGDVDAVRDFLLEHSDFNVNCVNYQKISALHVAVKQQNEAMVEFLLEQRQLDISDCALHAIKVGNLKIVEMILDKIREKSSHLEFAGTTHSVDFSDDLTPIILAAQIGNYEIIDFLIKRGHSIPPVHPPFCKCEACKSDLKKYDRLRYSTMKLNLYKAICNPMYIFHTTDDPFQRAFELTKELQDAATVFPQFKVSFEELWTSLRTFSVELIGCCRNSQEVEIVLKKSPRSVADHVKFPRLQYAIDLKQKEFVSHPYTQAVLNDAWTGELLEWKIRSPLMQSLSVLPRIPMLPIMTIMCIFLPTHSLVRKWKTPVNKMISSVASYIIFLLILFFESNLDKTNQKRGPPNSGLEVAIIIYVFGYIWLHIRTCFKQGFKRFFSTMWHWYDTIMLTLFTLTIVSWIASWVDITANNDIDLPRKYWNSLDPELVAEGFFAAAVIMAFFRLNMFLSLNYHLGPLQVSIGKMTLDIFRFIIIFFIIILAWCAGLCRFYQPYEGMVQKDAASGTTTTQVSSFVSFLMTLKTFFWAIFGMSPIESADVIIENLPGDTPGTTIINKHQFTETVGYIAFALYQFLSVVVVLNMLVACMANTFTKVIDNVAVEWVFGRSQIYLSFMASSVLPPPFNLVPTASGIKDMFTWFRLLAKPSDGQRAKCSFAHCCYIESDTEAYVNIEFPSLMSELAQRYIRLKADVEEEDVNHDLDEIRNEIFEVKELLRKVHTSSIYKKSKA